MPERTVRDYIDQLFSIEEELRSVNTTITSPSSVARVEQRTNPDGTIYYVHAGNEEPQVESVENGFSDFVENLRRARERSRELNRTKEEPKIPLYKEDPNNKTIPW